MNGIGPSVRTGGLSAMSVAAVGAVMVVVLAVLVGVVGLVPPRVVHAGGCLLPPVDSPVVDPFRQPACPYCAGNRVLEYRPAPGTVVLAAAGGRVTFAGIVALADYVVIEHTDGLRASYGQLATRDVATGDQVRAGERLGTTTGRFTFGLRDGDRYLDPEPLIGRLRFRPRLVPTDGRAGRPPPPPSLTCAGGAGSGPRRAADSIARGPSTGGPTIPLGIVPPAVASAPGKMPRQPQRRTSMAVITMRQMLDAGVHFGHQTRRWNPKMKRFIFGERNGIYIIDLEQTLGRVETAYNFVRELSAKGGSVLFIGTKKQAQDPVRNYALQAGMPYVNERWLGGMLTNFETIAKRVAKMQEYERMQASGEFEAMPKKEALLLTRELEKLQKNLSGIRNLTKRPDAVFILDTKKEHIAVTEANKLKIPVIAVVDTNVDPDLVQFPIPGNDDAIRANALMSRVIAEAVAEGRYISAQRNAQVAAIKRTPDEEAAFAAAQADARRAAAAAQAERDARVARAATPTASDTDVLDDDTAPGAEAAAEPAGETAPAAEAEAAPAAEIAPAPEAVAPEVAAPAAETAPAADAAPEADTAPEGDAVPATDTVAAAWDDSPEGDAVPADDAATTDTEG